MQGVAKERLEQAFDFLHPLGPLDISGCYSRQLIQRQHPQKDVMALFQHKQHELVKYCTAGNLHCLVHLLLGITIMTRQPIRLHTTKFVVTMILTATTTVAAV